MPENTTPNLRLLYLVDMINHRLRRYFDSSLFYPILSSSLSLRLMNVARFYRGPEHSHNLLESINP